MRLGSSVVTCAPLTTTAQVRVQVSCLHLSQPMPSGFPSVAFFWLQIVISPSVMQSIGREKNLVKNPQFTSKCSPDTSGPRLAGEGWGKFSSLEFLIDSLDFGFEHLTSTSPLVSMGKNGKSKIIIWWTINFFHLNENINVDYIPKET